MKLKWSDMEPRKRDVCVAIHVFGWRTPDYIDGEPVYPSLESVKVPHYTTDISDAWEVVEKTGVAIVPQQGGPPDDMRYMAILYGDSVVEDRDITVFASTAPEAVCLLALKAVGVDIE